MVLRQMSYSIIFDICIIIKVVTVLTQSLNWIGFQCFRFVLGSFLSPILFPVVFRRYCVIHSSRQHIRGVISFMPA